MEKYSVAFAFIKIELKGEEVKEIKKQIHCFDGETFSATDEIQIPK